MTGTAELAVREDTAPVLRLPALPSLPDTDSWIRAMASIAKLADQICDTSFVPKGLRGDPAAVTAAILTGRELDMPPMTALRHIHVVEGTPSLDAEYKRAKVLAAGHEFRILEWDDEHCKVAARRKGDRNPPLVVEYTIKDARRAGLVKDRGNYVTRPKVMMLARVTTLACNAIFTDVTNGLATSELLESGDEDAIADAIGAAVDAPERRRVTAAQVRRTVAAEVVTPDAASGDAFPVPAPEAASTAPDDTDYGTPGTVTGPMLTAIWTVLSQVYSFTKDEKEQARAVCAHIIGRDLATTTAMSFNDGRKVLDKLSDWQQEAQDKGEHPRDYLIAVMAAQEEASDGQ